MGLKKRILLILGGILVLGCEKEVSLGEKEYDVVVYGTTGSGVTASISAARNGAKVLLICEGKHIGGMTSSGLTASDLNSVKSVGGIAREFYQNIYKKYENPSAWKTETRIDFFERAKHRTYSGKNDKLKMQWVFESKIAEKVFNEMLEREHVEVKYDATVDEVIKTNGKIANIVMNNGDLICGEVFIDATYSGDLMAKSNITYTAEREGRKKYDETLAGYGHKRLYNAFNKKGSSIDPYIISGDSLSGLLPYIFSQESKQNGEADGGIQAYCYRMTLTNDGNNCKEIEKPHNYNSLLYEYLIRKIELDTISAELEKIITLTPMPNSKTDTNGIDFVGANQDWWNANKKKRESIEKEHRNFVLGLLWCLQNNLRVPFKIRNKMAFWGLAKDEFIDNDNFPYQLYIRESRRMVSDYIMNESDCLNKREVPNSVGYGSYSLDSHVVNRVVNSKKQVVEEGAFYEQTERYNISYKSLRPKKEECLNLLVPVCISASHVAYGSIRMEPVFMVLGHSVGTAAALCAKYNVSVQDIDYGELKEKLENEGQIL